MCSLLIAAGCDPTSLTEVGDPFLFTLPLQNATTWCALCLLAAGANVHAVDDAGNTSLLQACTHGQAMACDVLLAAGASANSADAAGDAFLRSIARYRHDA